MMKPILLGTALLALLLQTASAQYEGWQHSGSLWILTTPEGANLPATAAEEGFPLLVRLDKDWFDFSQARAKGEDIRFASSTGTPLAYEVDEWDAAQGTASIWVRIPMIKGKARQELKMFWGRADACSESKGAAVFNESNGYLSVWHMNDPVKDVTGRLEAKDTGTTSAPGVIGKSRHFDVGKGITCGENITSYPTGSSPHTSEAWFKAEQSNASILGWGNDHPQGKLIMQLFSPPHIKIECWFSGADVRGESTLPLSQWVHVVHTFQNGNSRIYVNGALDGISISTGAPLAIKSPARMYMGGWYDNYRFVGDIDEVRISKVMRSADWVKLQYENQKPLQTAVGPLVQAGANFSVSEKRITVLEGKSAAVSAEAGGAEKVYWILKSGDKETIAAVDRFHFTLGAGRVTGDQSLALRFKAVYADTVKTLDIPVTIKEDIPEPVFTLKAPATWDGRETIEVTPQIANREALQAKGVGELKYRWNASGVAVIKEAVPGKLLLKRSQNSGTLHVTLALSNGGAVIASRATITVQEPAQDAWVERMPDKDEKPVDNQFYARDDKNEGTLYYNGTLPSPPAPLPSTGEGSKLPSPGDSVAAPFPKGERGVEAESVFLKVYADDNLIKTESQVPKADKTYALVAKLKPGLIQYKVEFGTKRGNTETILHTAASLVCGDAYLIDGQSNAVSTDWAGEASEYSSPWIRSFGSMEGDISKGWGNAVRRAGGQWQIGYWGMDLARHLVQSRKIPICIINGAVGGTRIDQHQRNPANPTDATTIYAR